MSVVRLSVFRLAPNRSLCMATHNADSDSPFRTLRFRLRGVRHDFNNVLIHGDGRKLYLTAMELLHRPGVKKSSSFWDIFSKRSKLSVSSLKLNETVAILTAFDKHRKNRGIYSALAATLITSALTGPHCAKLLEIFSRHLSLKTADAHNPVFDILGNQIPNLMYQFTSADQLSILHSLHRAGIKNSKIAARFFLKISQSLEQLSLKDSASLCSALGAHGYSQQSSFDLLDEHASVSFDDPTVKILSRIFWGFCATNNACPKTLNRFSTFVIENSACFSRSDLRNIRSLVLKQGDGFDNLLSEIENALTTGIKSDTADNH